MSIAIVESNKASAWKTFVDEQTALSTMKSIIADHPRLSKQRVRNHMWDLVRHDEDLMEQVFDYWFSVHYYRNTPMDKAARARDEKAELARAEKRVFKTISNISLLGLKLPTGKLLGDSTGKEIAKLRDSMPKFFSGILRKIKPNQKVRDVFDNDALWKLYQAA